MKARRWWCAVLLGLLMASTWAQACDSYSPDGGQSSGSSQGKGGY
ncbi:hypothetical protein [Burkholderia sp. PU8-34]